MEGENQVRHSGLSRQEGVHRSSKVISVGCGWDAEMTRFSEVVVVESRTVLLVQSPIVDTERLD
jgi:hypothetical protein